MAAVTKGTLTIARENLAKLGKIAADVSRGDPLVLDSAAAVDVRFAANYKKATAETTIHGVALKDAKAGGLVEVLTEGEVEGYSGLTPGAPLSVAAGAIDGVAPSGTNPIQLIALTATRVWVKI